MWESVQFVIGFVVTLLTALLIYVKTKRSKEPVVIPKEREETNRSLSLDQNENPAQPQQATEIVEKSEGQSFSFSESS